jgi:malonyl-CoA/methylmalonyl-CoA synthetase
VITQWGVWLAGGIAVPLCTAHPAVELDYVIENAEVDTLITHPDFEARVKPIAQARGLRCLDITSPEDTDITPLPRIDSNRRAMIVYTSGTTSRPKGVVTTHSMIASQVSCLIDAWDWRRSDVTLHVLPLHHVHGIVNVLCCALWAGATCEMLSKFDASQVWKRFIQGHFTVFMAVPTIYVKLGKAWDESPPELQSKMSDACAKMRLMVSGSAALPVTVLEKWRHMTGHTFLERYGMTEIGMAISNPLNGERRPGYIGQPLLGVSVRLVDEDGVEIPDENVAGEIQVKGPNVFQEYWKKPDVTAKSFKDGWFCTGDAAIVENGYYRILGRNSVDIIKSGGYKISALEIEEVLRRHPAIDECSIVGIEDEEWGERVCAAIVLTREAALTLSELKHWCTDKLATYKIPKAIAFVNELPRNVMGKVTKHDVKKLF